MNDLDTLRPEIRDAVDSLDKSEGIDFAWLAVRAELLRLQSTESRANEWQLRAERAEAELLRLTDENARLVDCINAQPPTRRSLIDRAERAQAELAAIKERIAEAPVGVFGLCYNGHEPGFLGFPQAIDNLPRESMLGKRVRLVVDDPPAGQGE